MKELKVKVFDKIKGEFVDKMENKKVIFDCFENRYKVLDLINHEFYEIDGEKYDFEVYEYIGQKDINGDEIYDNDDIIFSEQEIEGKVRYNSSTASFDVVIIDDEISLYSEAIIEEDYKIIKDKMGKAKV